MTTLYLDFDGVLHPDNVHASPEGLTLRSPGTLFMHAQILTEALGYHPEVNVILSTSWVRHLGYESTLAHLPPALRARIKGSTWGVDNDRLGKPTFFGSSVKPTEMTRFQQIWAHVCKNDISDWIALDDLRSGSEPWLPAYRDNLILCDGTKGLGDPDAQAALNTMLVERQYGWANTLSGS